MKRILCSISIVAIAFMAACDNKDDMPMADPFEYHAHIHSPDAANKHVGDTMNIEIEFESHTGMPVHHINIRIYNVVSTTEVYNKPDEAHIHELDGAYVFSDVFVLSESNGLAGDTDWILEARVWGHDDGVSEVTETVEFHVRP